MTLTLDLVFRSSDEFYAKGNACLTCPSFAYSVILLVVMILLIAFIINVMFKADVKASKMMTKYKGKCSVCSQCSAS